MPSILTNLLKTEQSHLKPFVQLLNPPDHESLMNNNRPFKLIGELMNHSFDSIISDPRLVPIAADTYGLMKDMET